MSYISRTRPRDPKQIFGSKLKLWFDVRDWQVASRMTIVDDAISSWTDRVSGLIVTNATAAQRPTLVTGTHGRKVARFDSALSQRLRGTDTTGLPSGPTPFYMHTLSTLATLAARFVLAVGTPTNYGRLGGTTVGGTARTICGSSGTHSLNGNTPIPLDVPTSFGAFIDPVLRFRRFGKLGTSTSASEALSTGTGTLALGCNAASTPANFFSGDIEQVFIIVDPTLTQLIELDLWLTRYASLTNQLDGYADIDLNALTGNGAILLPATHAVSAGLGPVGQIASTASPLAPGVPFPLDPSHLHVSKTVLYSDAVSTQSASKKENGVIFCDSYGTQVGSEFVGFTDDGDYPSAAKSIRRIIIAPYGTTLPIADVTAPAGATHYKPFVRDVGSSGFTMSAIFRDTKIPLSTATKTFDGLRFVGVWGLQTLVTGYQGPLVTTQRTDGALRTWWAKSDGTFPVDDFQAWEGTLRHVITDVYDQVTGRRTAVDTNKISYINFDGQAASFGGKSPEFLLTASARGILRGAAGATITALRLTDDPRQYQSSGVAVAQWAQGDDSGNRMTMHLSPGVQGPLPDGRTGFPSVSVSRLDSDAPVVGASTGMSQLSPSYAVQTVAWDGATGDATTWMGDPADGGEKAVDAAITSTGNMDTTMSSRALVGNFLGAIVAFGIRASKWSDAEQTLLCTRLTVVADMTLITEDTRAVYAATRNWVNRPLIVEEAGVITHGSSDNTARRNITEWPNGRRTMVSDTTSLLRKYSDHVAPINLRTSTDKRFISYSSHAVDNGIFYRLSSDDTIANLGSETFLQFDPVQPAEPPTANGTRLAEYVSGWSHGSKILLASQMGDWHWVWLRWMDDTEGTPTWEACRHFLAHTTGVYVQGGMVDANVLRYFAYPRTTMAENHVRAFEVNLSTGLHTAAGGLQLGYWDGTAGNTGNVLPVSHDTLPIVVRVPEDRSYRPTDCPATVIAGVEFDSPANDASVGQIVVYVLVGVDPFSEVSWFKLPGLPSAGQTFDAENVRFCDVCVNRKPHSGLELFICRREGTRAANSRYFLEKWRSPSGLGGDWVVTLLKSSPYILSRPISAEGSTTDRVFVLETSTYNNLTYDVSRDLIIG